MASLDIVLFSITLCYLNEFNVGLKLISLFIRNIMTTYVYIQSSITNTRIALSKHIYASKDRM